MKQNQVSPDFMMAAKHALYCLQNEPARYEEACLKAASTDPEAWMRLGAAELEAGQCVVAMKRFAEALQFAKPDDKTTRMACFNNLGFILSKMGDTAAARRYFDEGMKIDRRAYQLLNNLALCQVWENKPADAFKTITMAISRNPRFHNAYFTRALIHLVQGNLVDGWRDYENRFSAPEAKTRKREVGKPEWDTFNPRGKSILLYSEQGVGDTLQFIRFAPRLRAAGATVYLECQRGLRDLLAPLGCFAGIFEDGEALPLAKIDCVFPIMSLPRAFRISLADLEGDPNRHGYLKSDREVMWVDAGSPARPYKVGIAWGGSQSHANDQLRSIPFDQFKSILGVAGVEYFSLQIGPKSVEAIGEAGVVDETREIKTYADTARYIAGLDLVIAVDTSVVHLAGAMGVPCWVLLPFSPDWRWLLNRDDSPWYDSLKLFRQEKARDWSTVLAAVRENLTKIGEVHMSRVYALN